ncbi:MAG: hypothetical protein DHS20C15_08770 [Planctomycetota bacterium]|nr:MAG: hypothetical protein DHS20C15_08770 [Planctomycetota bacterium]
MRLIAVLLLALPLAAQSEHYDPDFELRITPPAGMQLLTPELWAANTGKPAESFRNKSRPESVDGVAVHEWVWLDATGRGRELQVVLNDRVEGEAELLNGLDAFASYVEEQFGVPIDVEDRDVIRRNNLTVGYRVEGNATRSDGAQIRKLWCYVPLLVGSPTERDRVALISYTALLADWEDFLPDFDASIASMTFPLPRLNAPSGARAGGAGQAGAGAGGQGRGRAPEAKGEGWGSLQVTGSILLALVLLGSLFVGGAKKAGAGA